MAPRLRSRAQVVIRGVAAVNLAVIVLPVLGMRATGAVGLLNGVPWQMDVAGILAVLAAGAVVPLAAVVWLAARASSGWAPRARLAPGALLLMQMLFALVLAYWNLVGIRH